MKKIKIGNPQFPETYLEKEYSDDKSSLLIAVDLALSICDKFKIHDSTHLSPVSIKRKLKNFKTMYGGFEKQINNLDPKLASEIRSKSKIK